MYIYILDRERKKIMPEINQKEKTITESLEEVVNS